MPRFGGRVNAQVGRQTSKASVTVMLSACCGARVDPMFNGQSRCFSQRTPSPAAHQAGLSDRALQSGPCRYPPQRTTFNATASHTLGRTPTLQRHFNPMRTLTTKLTDLVAVLLLAAVAELYGSTARVSGARSKPFLSICRSVDSGSTNKPIRVTDVQGQDNATIKLCKNQLNCAQSNRARQRRISSQI